MNPYLAGSVVYLLLWVPLAAFAWYTYRRTRPAASQAAALSLTGLRTAVLGLLLLLLAEPVLERWHRRVVKPALLILLDTSSSMALAEGDSTRMQRAVRVLEDPAMQRVLGSVDVQAFRFAASAVPLALDTASTIVPAGRATDLAGALETALQEAASRSEVRGVLLLSDGAHNLGPDPVSGAGKAGVPVFGLAAGSVAHPPDVQIARARMAGGAYVGQALEVEVELRAWQFAGRPVTVYLREDSRSLGEAAATLGKDGETISLVLRTVPERGGPHLYRVVVSELPGESATDNNEALVYADVQEERSRVLLLGAAPGPDLAFLRRALEADSSMAVRLPKKLEPESLRTALLGEQMLAEVDVAALVDPGRTILGGEPGHALADWVQSGGGLLLMFGPHAIQEWQPSGPMAGVLPVSLPPRPVLSAERVRLRLGPAGQNHPVTRLREARPAGDPWRNLPPLPGLVRSDSMSSGGAVLLEADGTSAAPAVVAGRAGEGRVIVALGGAFWRLDLLSSGVDGDPETVRTLWRNAVKWLSRAGSGGRVRVWSESRVYRSGDRLVFKGQVFDELLRPQEGAEVTVELEPGDVSIPLLDQGGGNYGAQWPAMEPGEYRFVARAALAGDRIGRDEGQFVVEPYSLESVDVRADPQLLAEMSRVSGGLAVPLDQWQDLLERLPLQQRVVRERADLSLWPQSWALVVVLGLLVLEWSLRKRYGMI